MPEGNPNDVDLVEGNEATYQIGSRALGGSVWSTLSAVTPLVSAIAVSAVAARALGPTDMGRQSYISFVVLAVTTLCMLGMPPAIIRYVGDLLGREEAWAISGLLRWVWRLELVAAAIGGAVLVFAALQGATPMWAWIAGAAAVVAGVLHKVPASFLIGSQRWRSASVMIVVTNVLGAALTIVVLLAGGGITSMLVIAAAAGVALLLWTMVTARRALDEIGVPTRAQSSARELHRPVLSYAGAATVPILLEFVVYQRFEFFFLQHSSTAAEIAVYSIAFSAAGAMAVLPTSFVHVFTPVVATLHGAGSSERIRRGFGRAVRLLTLVTLPLTAFAVALGPGAINMVYGPGYEGTRPVFLILMVTLVLTPILVIGRATLWGAGKMRVPILASTAAAVTDIVLAALLIPHLGSIGAALANVSAQLVAGAWIVWAAVRFVGGVELHVRALTKGAIASVCCAASAILVDRGSSSPVLLVLGFVAGAAVFGAVAAVLRIVPRDDASWLVDAVGDRGFGIPARLCAYFVER